MTLINEKGYLERQLKKGFKENIWLVKQKYLGKQGIISIKNLLIPSKYVGKRVKIKIIVEEVE